MKTSWREGPPSVSEVQAGQKWWWRKPKRAIGGYFPPRILFAVVSYNGEDVVFKLSEPGNIWVATHEEDLWQPVVMPND